MTAAATMSAAQIRRSRGARADAAATTWRACASDRAPRTLATIFCASTFATVTARLVDNTSIASSRAKDWAPPVTVWPRLRR
jgi:hypothetical protein